MALWHTGERQTQCQSHTINLKRGRRGDGPSLPPFPLNAVLITVVTMALLDTMLPIVYTFRRRL